MIDQKPRSPLNRSLRNILVTGGSGFIGSHFIKFLLTNPGFAGRVINLDVLTYAANPARLSTSATDFPGKPYFFEQLDICDQTELGRVFQEYQIDTVVHLAAETHVDRSIENPAVFVHSNILGTFSVLEAARKAWRGRQDVLFHHVSTDEVFGSLPESGAFVETTAYSPRSPYSASKASSDHLVAAWFHSYGLPVTISNCSNNYGPGQYPDKLIPLMLSNMLAGRPLPLYGDGRQIRDWLFVEDHCRALWMIIGGGHAGESYNIGGGNEWQNLHLINKLAEILAGLTGCKPTQYLDLIKFVADRPGHDRRYAMDSSKLQSSLGWKPIHSFSDGLDETVRWYLDNYRSTINPV